MNRYGAPCAARRSVEALILIARPCGDSTALRGSAKFERRDCGDKLKCLLMPIVEIIDEVDAYLSRLHQARELLLKARTEAAGKKAPRRQGKARVRPPKPVLSIRRRGEKSAPRSDAPVARTKAVPKRAAASAEVPDLVADQPTHGEHPANTEPERTVQEGIPITRLPARRRTSANRPVRARKEKPVSANNPEAMKPAIALGGPMHARIVVVPAEQVQRERTQAAAPAAPRPRPQRSGLTGRLAFEALFKDGTGSS